MPIDVPLSADHATIVEALSPRQWAVLKEGDGIMLRTFSLAERFPHCDIGVSAGMDVWKPEII